MLVIKGRAESNYTAIEPYMVITLLALYGIIYDLLPQSRTLLLIVPLGILITLSIFNIILHKLVKNYLIVFYNNVSTKSSVQITAEESLYELNPYHFQEHVKVTLSNGDLESKINSLLVLKSIAAIDQLELLSTLQHDLGSEEESKFNFALNETIKYLNHIKEEVDKIENVYEYVEQTSRTDVIKGLLRLQIEEPDKNLVIKLLNDNRSSVIKAACLVAGYHNDINFISLLIEKLSNPRVSIYARFALQKIGVKVVKYLEIEFSKNRGNLFFIEACFDVLSKIKNAEAHNLLFSSLNDSNKNIVRMAAKKLIQIYPNPTEEKRKYFANLFNVLIVNTLTNIFIIKQIDISNQLINQLKTTFSAENNENLILIKKLLQQYYAPKAIAEILSHFENPNIYQHNLSNNLADIYIDKNLNVLNKVKILLSPNDTRLKEFLLEEFPDFEFDIHNLLEEDLIWYILNMDYDKVSNWTRACAINTLKYLDSEDIPFELATEFLNENKLMQETAAICIYNNLPEFYSIYLNRLESDNATKLDFKVRANTSNKMGLDLRIDNLLLYDKIQFLSSIPYLKELNINELTTFEPFFKPIVLEAGNHEIELNHEEQIGFWIIESGRAKYSSNGISFNVFNKRDIIEVLPSSAQAGKVYFELKEAARFLIIEKIVLLNILKNSYNTIFTKISEITDFSSNLPVYKIKREKVA